MSKRSIITLVLFFIVLFGAFATSYTPEVDESSTYKPTQIVNGSFDTYPWMNYTNLNGVRYTEWSIRNVDEDTKSVEFNGVGKGWNTTEIRTWFGNLFEFVDKETHWHQHNLSLEKVSKDDKKFVEMNCQNSAILYQDLYTVGGDVIRWTLEHAMENSLKGDTTQNMRVEIGAPQRDDQGNICNANGIGNNLNWKDNTKLVQDSVAIFRNTGVTDYRDNVLYPSTIGYGNQDELKYLSLEMQYHSSDWYVAKGVYVVPEGQTVSRFAFVSEAVSPNFGNLLDNITFSTLIGNLSAVQHTDKSITISGYWGDSVTDNKLYIKFNTDSQPTAIDMSGVLNKNFTIKIPKEDIPANATTIEVYHQDYESAKRTLEIIPGYNVLMYVGNTNKKCDGSGTNLGPSVEAIKTLYEATTSTNTGKVKISALYTEDQSSLINGTDLINEYSLIFVCFPDSFGTKTQTVADNLINYTKQGGCLVMIGEEVGGGQAHWYAGNVELSKIAKMMGIDITYGQNASGTAGQEISIPDDQHELIKVEGSMVKTLLSCAIPKLMIGQGSNTKNNTTIVGKVNNEPVITDTKVDNGYITFITDINIWMGWDTNWETIPSWPGDSKNFMKNLLTRSINNIKKVSKMNKITYVGLEGSHYASDGGNNSLTNPSKYSSTDTFTLNNPIKEGWIFTGWSGTGLVGNYNMTVTVPTGSTGDRYYTAHFSKHAHQWVYGLANGGKSLTAHCDGSDEYAYLCEYHGASNALVLEMIPEYKKQLTATVNAGALVKTVTWSSADESIATVDKNGLVTGLKPGQSTTIYATANDGSNITAECKVTIPGAPNPTE